MKNNNGNVNNRKVDINSVPVNITGNIAMTAITRTIIMLNAIIRILNFNVDSPYKSIKERLCYVNCELTRFKLTCRKLACREKPAYGGIMNE